MEGSLTQQPEEKETMQPRKRLTVYDFLGNALAYAELSESGEVLVTPANQGREAKDFTKRFAEDGVENPISGKRFFPKDGVEFINATLEHYARTSRYSADYTDTSDDGNK